MDIQTYIRIYTKAIEEFRKLLINDFEVNKDLLNLIQLINFKLEFNFIDWLKDPNEIHISRVCRQETLEVPAITAIDYQFKYIEFEKVDNYYFFDKKEFESIELARELKELKRYIMVEKHYKKVNKLIFDSLKGYKRKSENRFIKTFDENFGLEIYIDLPNKIDNDIQNYRLPTIYVLINGEQFNVQNLNSKKYRYYLFYCNDLICHFFAKYDYITNRAEPSIYFIEETGKYMVSNSVENLAAFNKYILFWVEIFVHYHQIFEKFVVEHFVPNLRLELDASN